MKAKMAGITVPGYHSYQNEKATMQIKLFGLVPIVDAKGHVMDKAETVTVFNDMCLMAPATLVDKRISWSAVDSVSAKAVFTNGANAILATLFFNEAGQLVNFYLDDRTDISDMKQYGSLRPLKITGSSMTVMWVHTGKQPGITPKVHLYMVSFTWLVLTIM